MPTTFSSLKVTGTSVFASAITATAITLSGAFTGTTGTFSGAVTASQLTQSASTASGFIVMTSGNGTATGSYICVRDPADGSQDVCAFSGGLLDCNNFGHVTCP